MAFDGITTSSVINELKQNITGGRVDKIYQPESDEIIMTVRNMGKAFKLLITANASHPRIHFTKATKNNPMQPPLFCMVLRKHLTSGKIIDITQPQFERIVNIYIESMNEMGDYSTKCLRLEIMGRHSNLILTDENEIILDCAKHITHDKSSVREVLPGKKYAFPPSKEKVNPLELSKENFIDIINKNSQKIQAAIYKSYTGISPITASEICFRAETDASLNTEELTNEQIEKLFNSFSKIVENIKLNNYYPNIIYDETNKPTEFSPIEMKMFSNYNIQYYDSISELLEQFYKEKDTHYRLNQKSQDLKKIINQNIERCVKKKDIQVRTIKEIANRDLYKLYGELITSNIYTIKKGMNSFTSINFYDENQSEITIPLESELTPAENAQKYFKRYNKEKRTYTALQTQMKQNDDELEYLEGLLTSVQNAVEEQDIKEIREELSEQGFIKKIKNTKGKAAIKKSKPLHYISSDGFDIYVGKNNRQNDELTLKTAKGNDIWLHTKKIPGSHVIIISSGQEVPEKTLNEAANLAAYYSKGRSSSQVPVDYTQKKNVKKPAGAKPGMVIYETNKTAYITPDETIINKLKQID